MAVDLDDPIMEGYVPLGEIIEDEGGVADGKVAEEIQLSVAALAFANTGVSYESETLPIVVTNVGYDPVHFFGDPTLTGDFLLKSSVPGSLLPGESVTITVAFKPTAVGLRSGSIYFNTGDAAGDELVTLSGTGIVSAPEVPPAELAETILQNTARALPYSDGELADITAEINTTLKVEGRLVWDSINQRLLVSSGSAAADPWKTVTGDVAVIPV